MTDQRSTYWDENPTIEVRVFRHDLLVETERCESAEEVARVMDRWSDAVDVRYEMIDLVAGGQHPDFFEPGPPGDLMDDLDEDYPHHG